MCALEIAASEAAADQAWEKATTVAAAPSYANDDRWERLRAVMEAHRDATSTVTALLATDGVPEASRQIAREKLEPLWSELLEAAGAVASLPASCGTDVRAKALAIMLLCEEASDDIIERLALGLARDILGNVGLQR